MDLHTNQQIETLKSLVEERNNHPLSIKRLSEGTFSLISLYNSFTEQHPDYFNIKNSEEGINEKWCKGGCTSKGIYWDSLAWPSFYLLQAAGADTSKHLFDCGSGTGETDIAMNILLGTKVTAMEYDSDFHQRSIEFQDWLSSKGLSTNDSVNFLKGDFLEHDISKYDIMYYFNYGTFNPKGLESHILDQIKPRARFVVFHFSDGDSSYQFYELRQNMDLTTHQYGAIFTKR
jgi:hypothetical protein